MKSPREVAHEILGIIDKDFLRYCGRDSDDGSHYVMCDRATAAITARDAEHQETPRACETCGGRGWVIVDVSTENESGQDTVDCPECATDDPPSEGPRP